MDSYYLVRTSLTEYEFYIKAVCASGDTSVWDGPYVGKTSCGTYASIPYLETFTTYVPECWFEAENLLSSSDSLVNFVSETTSDWNGDGFANVGSSGAARLNVFGTTKKDWIISPSFNLGTGLNYVIDFDIAFKTYYDNGEVRRRMKYFMSYGKKKQSPKLICDCFS